MAVRGKKHHSSLYAAFVVSLVFHLLTLLLSGQKREVMANRYFQVQRLPSSWQNMPFVAGQPKIPPRRMEPLMSPEPLHLPTILQPDVIAIEETDTTVFSIMQKISTLSVPTKSAEFEAKNIILLDENEVALEGVRRQALEYEHYARFRLFDADTNDADSQNRKQAKQIVERAIGAMGGREALLKITQLHIMVWIEQTETMASNGVIPVPIYVYPVAIQHFKGFDIFINEHVEVKFSMDTKKSYILRDPPDRWNYYRLFDNRWSFLKPQLKDLRQQGEAARWHFIDRFFGEGVVLNYMGTEKFQHEITEVIRVDDKKYGHYYLAFFDQRTGLLSGTREGLNLDEQQWYCQKYMHLPPPLNRPPVWTTVYQRYRSIHGILTPHCLVRSLYGGPKITTHLEIAYNDMQLAGYPPNLDY